MALAQPPRARGNAVIPELPYDAEAEQATLGALLIDPTDAWATIGETFDPAAFFNFGHQNIAKRIAAACIAGRPPDPILIRGELVDQGLDGADLVHDISKGLGTSANVAHYWGRVQKVAELRHRRQNVKAVERARTALGIVPRPSDVANLRRRQKSRFVPLADLPEGQGWGAFLDKLTGGGLAPGSLVGFGAAGTGAGKTAFLMQLLDGLALRSALTAADPEATVPLTPVTILSEMAPEDLECRTLGRLLDVAGQVFAAGESAKRWHKWGWVDEQYKRAEALMQPGGVYHRLSAWQRIARPDLAGAALVDMIEEYVLAWVDELERAHPGREVIPVIAVDPINRFLPADGRSEVETLGETAALFDRLADRRRWLVAVTADTNKTAAKEPGENTGAASVFRGSMQLLHAFDLTLVLTPGDADRDGVRDYGVSLDKNRHGQNGVGLNFRWHTKTGLRFVAETEEEWKKRTQRTPGIVESNLRARIIVTIGGLAAAGLIVTRTSMRSRAKDLGVSRDALEHHIDQAVIDGYLAEQPKPGKGGGSMLVPTGKSPEGLITAGAEEVAGEVAEEPAETAPATSGEFGELPATKRNDEETRKPAEVAGVVTLREIHGGAES